MDMHVINDLNGEEIIGTFMKKNRKKQIKKNLERKLIKRKVN